MLLKYVYVVFIGLLLALFIGVGIAAFYPTPLSPSYETKYARPMPYEPITASQSAKLQGEDIKQQEIWREFEAKNQQYNKNVAVITTVASILVLVVSLLFAKSILVIADGLLFGGLLTLIYSLIRSFGTKDYKFMFLVIFIGLFIAVTLGYIKLIKPSKSK